MAAKNDVPDTKELKAKYAEIAALKKAIDAKRSENQLIRGLQQRQGREMGWRGRRTGWRGRGGRIGRARGTYSPYPMPYGLQNELSVKEAGAEEGPVEGPEEREEIEKGPGNLEEGDNKDKENPDQYMTSVSPNGMTVMNAELYDQNKEKIQLQAKLANNLKNKILEQKRQRIRAKMMARNLVKYDSCDRIMLNSTKYCVVRGGSNLVPISLPVSQVDPVQWNGQTYYMKKNGTLKCPSRSIR